MLRKADEHSLRYTALLQSIFTDAQVSRVPPENEQAPAVREEGNKAFIVDYPILRVLTNDFNYRVRSTTAVCYRNSTTKNWTRVSLEDGIPMDNDVLNHIKETYNTIVGECCKLNQNLFTEVIRSEFQENPKPDGDFTILTFGINDRRLGKILELFDDIDLKLEDLFTDELEAKRIIESYYKSLFNEQSLNKGKWVTSNVSFVTNDNIISDSNVLYNIKRNAQSTIIEGIGHDESHDGIVARVSSLKVARFIEEITKPEFVA